MQIFDYNKGPVVSISNTHITLYQDGDTVEKIKRTEQPITTTVSLVNDWFGSNWTWGGMDHRADVDLSFHEVHINE